jgi:hypothetical protein
LILPDNLKTRYCDNLKHWLDVWGNHIGLHEHEIAHVSRLINYLEVVETPHREAFEMPKLQNDFKYFYTQYDQRRNKNFVNSFPGLADWYNTL